MRFLSMFASIAGICLALPWPHHPTNQPHHIGNAWGSYQNYGSSPYLHNGQDIMTSALAPAVAIKRGYVKAIWLGGSPMYNGVTVADSAGAAFCSGFMYYHIDNSTIQVQVGDTVEVGDTLGLIATWSVANFHHNHFSRNRNSGVTWPDYGGFYKNPLMELEPDDDSITPNFVDAYTGQRFAICQNNTSTYLTKDSVYGDVDLICRLDDRINHRLWRVAVFKVAFGIRDTFGNYVVPMQVAIQFTDSIDGYNPQQSRAVYKQDATCPTRCNYDSLARQYFYIFTNTDYDSVIESSDSLAGWNTTTVADGNYWVIVAAWDEYGNTAWDSMLVKVRNNLSSRRDVGVTAIRSPGVQVDSGSIVTPACTVYNFGTFIETYSVRMKVGTVYDDTAVVAGHAPGTAVAVQFPSWSVNCAGGSYPVSCSTQLANDTNPANDRRTATTMVAIHDVGATGILSPAGVVDSGVSVTPSARVRNYGNVAETFMTEFSISDGYVRTLTRTVPAGADTVLQFPNWIPQTVGRWVTRCTTRLATDVRPGNDKVEDSVIVASPQAVLEAAPGSATWLGSVSPSPVRGRARVGFQVPVPALVSLRLYDAAGSLCAVILDGMMPAGRHQTELPVRQLSAGVYWLEFETGAARETRKVVVADR